MGLVSCNFIEPRQNPIEEIKCIVGTQVKSFLYPHGLVIELGKRRSEITHTNYTVFEVVEKPEGFTFTKTDDYGIDIDYRLEYKKNVTGVIRYSPNSETIYIAMDDGDIRMVNRHSTDYSYPYFMNNAYSVSGVQGKMGNLVIKPTQSHLYVTVGKDILVYYSYNLIFYKRIANVDHLQKFLISDISETISESYLLTTYQDGKMGVFSVSSESLLTPKDTRKCSNC